MSDAVQISQHSNWSVVVLKNRVLGVLFFEMLLILCFSLLLPQFFSVSNLNTIFLNACIMAVLASAEAVVIITRNYDVSIASILALSAFLGFDIFMRFSEAGPILILVPVLIGALCGLANGAIVAFGRVNSVFVTLGGLSIYRGIATVYADGRQIEPKDVPVWAREAITGSVIPGISNLPIIAIIVVVVVSVYLRYTRTGRQIYAIGSNPDASKYYGLNVPRVTLQAYVICGALTGLAGFLFGSRSGYIVPWLAQGLEMEVIGAVVIGGVSVLGGSGNVVGAALGAVVLATIGNGLILAGSSEVIRQLIYGLAIVSACILDSVVLHRVGDLLKSKKRVGGV